MMNAIPTNQPLSDRIGRQARRKRQHQRHGLRPLWFGLGMFGMVGWSIALPTLVGAALGSWLDDDRWPGQVSWTLSLILIGLALGCPETPGTGSNRRTTKMTDALPLLLDCLLAGAGRPGSPAGPFMAASG